MVKDKLITIRIDEDVYDRFKDWARGNNTNISSALRDYIFSCLDPNKSIQNTRQNIDLDLSSHLEGLESNLYSKLYSRLVDELSSQKIVENIDNSSASQDIDIVNTEKAPSESLNLPFDEDRGDKVPEQEKPVSQTKNGKKLIAAWENLESGKRFTRDDIAHLAGFNKSFLSKPEGKMLLKKMFDEEVDEQTGKSSFTKKINNR
ncbi:BrnA antitoxin family protein [Cyanobacterium sp. DS4]|uniref:BrnA antitoxin family protein n=1 Tax=Cyanobacterium sp. DS4 TaxID=2878255 RepID=UPI002E80E88E|nr:BrnA antitoxin family protein [Cyanobacterium sp. Dongsha4]WVL02554.1 BrnA antitoxin family protein [Cyanobacterium sp. Dongsha4]